MIQVLCYPNHKPLRVRSASLYIVIIIALVVALLCLAMIATAYYYRAYHGMRARRDRLQNNVSSGLNLLLADEAVEMCEQKRMTLFESRDTVRLSKREWGGYDVGVCSAAFGRDSLVSAVLIGRQPDAAKWAAIWLADEDRPLSVSGQTVLKGELFLPKAGLRSAYIENHGFEGDKSVLSGKYGTSQRNLPEPDVLRLEKIDRAFRDVAAEYLPEADTIRNAFSAPLRAFHAKNKLLVKGITLEGNVILRCDSVLTIDSTAVLEDVLVFAPAIVVRPGFHGRCQLFARDSISIGARVRFAYPSLVAIVRTTEAQAAKQAWIRFGTDCSFFGGIMTWEKVAGVQAPAVYLGKRGAFSGQIYAGFVNLGDKARVEGSITCRRFQYRSGFSLYENYLVNADIDATALSRFYSSAPVFPGAKPKTSRIVRWLR